MGAAAGAIIPAAVAVFQGVSGAKQRTAARGEQQRAQMQRTPDYTPTAPRQTPQPVTAPPSLGQAIGGQPQMSTAQPAWQQEVAQQQSIGAPATTPSATAAAAPNGSAQPAAAAQKSPTSQKVADYVSMGATIGDALRGAQQRTASQGEQFRAQMQQAPQYTPTAQALDGYRRMYGGGYGAR